MWFAYLRCILVLLLMTESYQSSATNLSLYWDDQNEDFAEKHAKSVLTLDVVLGKTFLNIRCRAGLFSVIERVDERCFMHCSNCTRRDEFARCRGVDEIIRKSFRAYSPLNDLEYQRGADYFFTSTSSGTEEGMHNAVNGLCRTHRMKFKVRVSAGRPPMEMMVPPRLATFSNSPSSASNSANTSLSRLPIGSPHPPMKFAGGLLSSSPMPYEPDALKVALFRTTDKVLPNDKRSIKLGAGLNVLDGHFYEVSPIYDAGAHVCVSSIIFICLVIF